MKFGAVPDERLSAINLSLPKEPDSNKLVLTGKRVPHPKVYIGAAQWGDKSWVGKVYPAKTPATKFRELYPSYFNAAELNATHYTIYPPEVIRQWAEPARGKDFLFCPKFPQQISHYSNFVQTDELTETFLQSIEAFEENLGPVFLQLGEHYGPEKKKALFNYLASLPKHINFFLEVRHPEWFHNNKEKEELFATLLSLNIGAVITDGPGRRDAVHMHLTVPRLFLRFVCNALHPTSFNRTNDWVKRMDKWLAEGLEEAYIFLHPGSAEAVPQLAVYWIEELNNKCGLQLKTPTPIQPSLF